MRNDAPGFLLNMAHVTKDGVVRYRFWQRGGGYDRNIYSDAEVWEKIDYIHANPIARGLCQHPAHPFLSGR